MSGDTEATTVITQSQLWLLSQKERQVHLPFLPGCRKRFTTITFQPATNLFDRSSAFRLSSSFLRCVNSSDIPCQAVALCFSSCTVKASITALFPSQAPLQLSLSTAALQGQGSRKQQPSASQAQPCQLLPALQDSYNILFKGDLFPFQHQSQKQEIHMPKYSDSQRVAKLQQAKAWGVNDTVIQSVQCQF